MVTQGQIDMQTWLECFGLDAETVRERLKRFEGTNLDINYFSLMNGAATEAGRLLAPGIAALRASELGITLEPTGEETFASKMDKFVKQAETRDERRYDRQEKKKDKEREDTLEEIEIPLDKRLKPPRTDQQKVKLFAENNVEIPDDIPFVDTDKAEKLGKQILDEQNSKEAWVNFMIKELQLNQNARRAALNLENEILVLNGTSNSKNRIPIIRRYLPQIFASKINEDLPIFDKVEKAKQVYGDAISKATFSLEAKLSSKNDVKESIRNTLKEFAK
jgi:hypothetical protein